MATRVQAFSATAVFAPMSAGRLLVFGGIALVAGGMLFGDIFAVFVLHQNGGQTGQALLAATEAVRRGDPAAIGPIFAGIGGLMEDHGTKVDAHVHMTDAGYLALLLALVQPYIALAAMTRKRLAALFVAAGFLLPLGIFLIHYVGLAYRPFPVIGWASVLADSAGALLIIVLLAEAWGLWRYFRGEPAEEMPLPREQSWQRRALLRGGTWLILLGFLYGAWYAGVDLYAHEAKESSILKEMLSRAATGASAASDVNAYGGLAAERAVKIAAHSHIIEFGFLAILLSFIQPYVFLSPLWKGRWVKLLLGGSVILPVFVWLEVRYGLVAGGIADVGGLMVIVALLGMLVGVLRYSGSLDGAAGDVR
jgi:hypothetical protein